MYLHTSYLDCDCILCCGLYWTNIELYQKDLRSNVIFSVPSRGLMCPGTSFPKDKESIRCEKLYTAEKNRDNSGFTLHMNYKMIRKDKWQSVRPPSSGYLKHYMNFQFVFKGFQS